MIRSNRCTVSSGLICALAITLAACGPRPADSTVAQAPSAQATAASSTLSGPTDVTVVSSVRAALTADPQLESLDVDVQSAAGKVTLTGNAPDSAARDRVGQIVASVRGVTAVDNQLKDGT